MFRRPSSALRFTKRCVSRYESLFRQFRLAGFLLLAACQSSPAIDPPELDKSADAVGTSVVSDSPRVLSVFEANQGQAQSSVAYLSRGSSSTLFLTSDSAWISMAPLGTSATGARIKLYPRGGRPNPSITSGTLLPSKSNYFVGNNAARWLSGVPQYDSVTYHSVYPGVDIRFHRSTQADFEYDLMVAAGTDPGVISMGYEGADSAEIGLFGNFIIHTAAGDIDQARPIAYQEVGTNRRIVDCDFRMDQQGFGFVVGAHDPALPIIIDPTLAFSYAFGGSLSPGITTVGRAIALGASGSIYVAGSTNNGSFQTTPGAYDTTNASTDAFVVRLASDGTLLAATFLGGSGVDNAGGVAFSSAGSGSVFVAGDTASTDFPLRQSYQTTTLGTDVFVTKFDANLTGVTYSSRIGGSGTDVGNAIAVDASGNA